MNKVRLNSDLKRRCVEARITKLEGALLKMIRDLEFGQFTLTIHKIEGEPVRIEVISINSSKILDAKEGLNLDDSVYIDNFKQ
jgi:hypothetical protein